MGAGATSLPSLSFFPTIEKFFNIVYNRDVLDKLRKDFDEKI